MSAAIPVDAGAREQETLSNFSFDRILVCGLVDKVVGDGAERLRVLRDDRGACLLDEWNERHVSELHQFRIAKPDHFRLIEAGEQFRESASVSRASGAKKLFDPRRVAERCFLRSFIVVEVRFSRRFPSLGKQPHPLFVVGDGRDERLCRQQDRRSRDKKYRCKEENLWVVALRVARRQDGCDANKIDATES